MDAADVAVPTAAGGTLAARFFWPRELRVARTAKGLPALLAAASNGAATLIVHQYSVMGGSQDLMRGIARELAFRQGCVAVTFDLRGVGGSSGRCTLTGHAEADDVAEMGAWLEAAGFSRILLLCTSAGAPIGGSALDRVPAFTGYVALGYVFGFWASILFSGHYRAVLESTKPKLFIQGSRDEFTSPSKLLEWAVPQSKSAVTETRIIPDMGHFQLEGPDWDAAVARWAAAFGARHNCWGDATPAGPRELAAAEAAGADWDVRTELRERRESTSAVLEAARRLSSGDSSPGRGSRHGREERGRSPGPARAAGEAASSSG